MALGIYVGMTPGKWETFRSATEPTFESHGESYNAVVGPFRTVRGSKAMVHYGNGNPHVRTVSEAERVGKIYKEELKMEGLRRYFTPAAEEADRMRIAARTN